MRIPGTGELRIINTISTIDSTRWFVQETAAIGRATTLSHGVDPQYR